MSRIDESGDRDGLPNVLMEAQSQQLACLATRVAAIPELIVDGATGLLVEPRDRPAMTARLQRLITDPALRRRLGAAGRGRVHEVFSHDACIDALVRKFETAAGHPAMPDARAAE
jgi:glycosyltransferase involved in cell wall biosynthesis